MDSSATATDSSRRSAHAPRALLPILLGLLLVAGGLAVYVPAATDGLRPGPRQIDQSRVSSALFDSHTLGQVFSIDPAQTVGLRLWFTFPSGQPQGTLFARLHSFDLNRTVAETSISVDQIAANGSTDLRFTMVGVEDWPSDVPLYVELTLSTEGVAEATPIAGLGSSNRYSNGVLVTDGKQRGGQDLAFEVLYRGRLIDRWLPITNIAASRPGIFGWPPLYALLSWMMVWIVFVILLSLGRSLRTPAA